MAKVGIDNVFLSGVNRDVDPVELPPNVWTTATNARMTLQGVDSVSRYSKKMSSLAVEDALQVYYFGHNGIDYWVTANATKVQYDAGGSPTKFDNTFTALAGHGWNGGNLNGILILNNGQDAPVYWDGDTAVTTLPTLADWPVFNGAGGGEITARAKIIRPFRNFIIAMHITDTNTSPDSIFHQRVIFSSTASPGSIPASWDYTDPSTGAGHQDLTDTNGAIVDGSPLGNLFLVYKEDSLWAMNFSGSSLIFDFYKLSDDINCLATNCIASFPGGHAVLGNGDFYVHDGTGNYQSPLTRKMRSWLFKNIDPDNFERCFVTRQPLFNEIWICFPEVGGTTCTKALCWNWQTGALHIRELEGFRGGAFGIQTPPETINAWSDETALAWGDDAFTWDAQYEEVTKDSLVMVGAADESAETGSADTAYLRLMDTFDGDVNTDNFVLERLDIAISGQKSDGTPRVDRKITKLLTEVFPRIQVEGGGVTITVSIGGRMNPADNVIWDHVLTFDPTTQYRLFCLINYPLLALRFEATFTLGTKATVRIYGYDLEVKPAGVPL